ncbi:MAG: hypothetical protein ACI81L_002241 [Verrucomicrobiales bacterium]|jgi:hypothetical protein
MHTLHNPPENLTSTRSALHRLAMYVIAPVRHQATARFGLRSTPGGHGTPEFGGRRVRVLGDELIDEVAGEERRHVISSLQAAAEFLGSVVDPETAAEHDSPPVGDMHAPLEVDAAASTFLGSWYEMAFGALHTIAADPESVDASEAQLWPGHFDAAIEVGDEDHRGSYGASPGDDSIDEPYLYLSVWWPDKISIDSSLPIWNAPNFVGAMLRLSEFDTEKDPVDVAVEFWRAHRDALG